jgi:hypothetical protein
VKNLEDWKIKISVLWLFEAVALLAYMLLTLIEPGVIEQIMAGEIEGLQIGPELMLLFAVLVLVPLIMAFLTLTLRDSTNRWANIIVGIVVFGLNFIDLVDAVAKPSAWMTLLVLSKAVVLALIVWYAWKSKQKA